MNLQHENERFFRRLNPSSPSAEINKNEVHYQAVLHPDTFYIIC